MSDLQAWHIYELLDDGTKYHLATINTPDAEARAMARVAKILKDEGKIVYAEPYNGPVTNHR